MADVKDIVNMALGKVGNRAYINSIDDATPEAETAKVFYDMCRDAVLESSPWGFAQRRVVLAPLSGVTRAGWLYTFALPADCVSPIDIYSGHRTPTADQLIPFKVEGDLANNRILLCDLPAPELRYVSRIINTGIFRALFLDAIAWRLACELVTPIIGRQELLPQMIHGYEMALSKAIRADADEQVEDMLPDSEFITVRS